MLPQRGEGKTAVDAVDMTDDTALFGYDDGWLARLYDICIQWREAFSEISLSGPCFNSVHNYLSLWFIFVHLHLSDRVYSIIGQQIRL